ncbi:amidase [Streptosporangium sp. NPDC051023]|uniref:amidase n=1 Tax=Streptosporangium sp. NPDC051023 TaxID=3155410 RepID=UPI003450B1C2
MPRTRHLLAEYGGIAGLAAARTDLVRVALDRIAALDSELHAFTQVFTEPDAPLGGGPLAGVPVAVKDNIDVGGRITTLGRPAAEREPAARDAEVVTRLRNAGAVVVGKTNLPEFASSAVTVNLHYGDARNPWDLERTAGGSSGGSASAVAAGMVAAALGTDTGGSTLIPAALTGVCGFRPTPGRISLDGVVPLSPSFDTVGVCAVDPADISQVHRVLDVLDEAPARWPGLAGLRIGVLDGYFLRADDDVLARLDATVGELAAAGAAVRSVTLPSAHLVLEHARVIYGFEVADVYAGLLDRDRTYAPAVEARRAHPYGPADLARATAFRDAWRAELAAAFAEVDVLLTATTPTTAPLIASAAEESTTALIRHTYPFCLAGTPALSLPAGRSRGLPIGVMLVAPPGEDHWLLGLGVACRQVLTAFEKATEKPTDKPTER